MSETLAKLAELDERHNRLLDKLELLSAQIDETFREWSGEKQLGEEKNAVESEPRTLLFEEPEKKSEKRKRPGRKPRKSAA